MSNNSKLVYSPSAESVYRFARQLGSQDLDRRLSLHVNVLSEVNIAKAASSQQADEAIATQLFLTT